jgi:thiol-disulfide isomerase/thioredoxin
LTRGLIASLAAAAAVVAACGSESAPAPSPAPAATATATAVQTTADKPVPAQLQFTAKTIDGQEFSGESLLGKPAVMWFWAPWCPTCQREAPMVGQIAGANPDVTFVGVAALDQLPAMQQFVNEYPVKGFSHLADTDGAVWAKFGVTQQPAYAFIGADGSVDVVRGSLSEAELTERVTALPKQ